MAPNAQREHVYAPYVGLTLAHIQLKICGCYVQIQVSGPDTLARAVILHHDSENAKSMWAKQTHVCMREHTHILRTVTGENNSKLPESLFFLTDDSIYFKLQSYCTACQLKSLNLILEWT